MPMLKNRTARSLIAGIVLLSSAMNAYAWEPGTGDLDKAIKAGDFATYYSNVSAWLNQQAPAHSKRITEAGMKAKLSGPVFANALGQRQLISKLGVDNINAFAQEGVKNRTFLTWLLKNTEAMERYLIGATPTGIKAREANTHRLSVGSLRLWNKIQQADPESKEGIPLKLAIATALNPPGTGNRGAGGQNDKPAEPVGRYKHFKLAHQNNELFPTFDDLTVWEYRQIVSSCASDSDLAWAREMINTWRPDLRVKQLVVNSTSEVWRRNSPFPYNDSFKRVLAGGGKCGPRSSWGIMICQAFGIPAVGVRQPGHVCIAYKSVDPDLQPQPGNVWKIVYGRDWHVSIVQGLPGLEFLEAIKRRSRVAEFAQAERLRWFASTLTSTEHAAAVMSIARKVGQSAPAGNKLPAKGQLTGKAPAPASKPEPPFKKVPGVLHTEAETHAKTSGVRLLDCYTGGKQVNFQKNVKTSWIDYAIDVPTSGVYELTLRTATPNVDQVLHVLSGESRLATVDVPNTTGLWGTTEKVELKLEKGAQTLRLSAPYQRGIALRWLEIKAQ